MVISKSQAIRAVVFEEPYLSNQKIKAEVRRRYGLEVEGNLIIQAVGKEADRLHFAPFQRRVFDLAKSLLTAARGLKEAIQILRIAEGGGPSNA